jgi:hypothetical protein
MSSSSITVFQPAHHGELQATNVFGHAQCRQVAEQGAQLGDALFRARDTLHALGQSFEDIAGRP